MPADDIATKLSVATYIANGNGRSIYDIAEHFGISERTVYRILDRFQEEGYPLTNEERRNGREKLWTMLHIVQTDEYGTALPASEFTDEEKILIHYMLSELKKDEDILPSFRSVRMKISNMLSQKAVAFPSIDYPESTKRKLYPIENINEVAKNSPKEVKKHVSRILLSIRRKVRCNMVYHVPNKESSLIAEISPIFVFFFDGGMYLQALIDDGNLRTYAIERIENIEEVKGSCALLPDFDPKILLADPFGPFIGKDRIDAEVLIAPAQVHYIKERKWPSSVSITDNEDGSAVFRVTTYGEHEFTNWLLSQKASAVLIKPEWLREKLKAMVNDIAACYG